MTNTIQTQEIIISKTYFYEDQEQFAALSGDFNPIHMNHEVARREIFGEIVVHGVHLVLEALNLFVNHSADKRIKQITAIIVKFFNPVFISREVKYTITPTDTHVNVEVRDQKGLLLTEMKIALELMASPLPTETVLSESFVSIAPDCLQLGSMSQTAGTCELYLKRSLCNTLFPDLLKGISAMQVAELLAITRIVGMKCPGLQSLFSGIDLKFELVQKTVIQYQIKKIIEKFSIITLAVEGPSLSGELLTLFRPPTSRQPSIKEIACAIPSGCFQNMEALIIGGSRGIGETTAKIIAAGGGKPIITYNTGKKEAEQVCREIQEGGFESVCIQMSIDDLDNSLDNILVERNINAVYYYPSPKILGSSVFDIDLFRKFCYYYVEQFSALIKGIKSRSKTKMVVFYPSTVAIDEKTPGLTEYIMAKEAGEYLCETLNKELKDINIYIERLPRLQTDQTLNMQNYPAQSVSKVMFPILVEINALLV